MNRRAFIVGAASLIAAPAFAQRRGSVPFYVARDGNDGNDGSSARPFRTIGRAMKSPVRIGDEIIIRPGTYYEAVYVNKSLTIRAETIGTVLIDASGTGKIPLRIAANNVTVQGIDVTGGDGWSGIVASRVVYANIDRCRSYLNTDSGIYIAESDCCSVTRCECFENAAGAAASGISIHKPVARVDVPAGTFRFIIRDNYCHDNVQRVPKFTDGNGIILDDFLATKHPHLAPFRHPALVERNRCERNGGDGILAYCTDHAVIRRNDCRNNGQTRTNGIYGAELGNRFASDTQWTDNVAVSSVPGHSCIANASPGRPNNERVTYRGNLTWRGVAGAPGTIASPGNVLPLARDNRLGVRP